MYGWIFTSRFRYIPSTSSFLQHHECWCRKFCFVFPFILVLLLLFLLQSLYAVLIRLKYKDEFFSFLYWHTTLTVFRPILLVSISESLLSMSYTDISLKEFYCNSQLPLFSWTNYMSWSLNNIILSSSSFVVVFWTQPYLSISYKQKDGGIEYFNTVVVQPHKRLVTNQGKGYHIRCRYQTQGKTISNNYNASSIGTTPVLSSAPMPSCSMKILMTDSGKEMVAESVKIGDRLTLTIAIDDQGKAFFHDSFSLSLSSFCKVRETKKGNPFDFVPETSAGGLSVYLRNKRKDTGSWKERKSCHEEVKNGLVQKRDLVVG